MLLLNRRFVRTEKRLDRQHWMDFKNVNGRKAPRPVFASRYLPSPLLGTERNRLFQPNA